MLRGPLAGRYGAGRRSGGILIELQEHVALMHQGRDLVRVRHGQVERVRQHGVDDAHLAAEREARVALEPGERGVEIGAGEHQDEKLVDERCGAGWDGFFNWRRRSGGRVYGRASAVCPTAGGFAT